MPRLSQLFRLRLNDCVLFRRRFLQAGDFDFLILKFLFPLPAW
jgi:hypothetical protein